MNDKAGKFIKRALILAALCAFFMPAVKDRLDSSFVYTEFNSYSEDIEKLSSEDIEKMREDAVLYNKKIEIKQKSCLFRYNGASDEDAQYCGILGTDGGVMAYLEIPSVDIFLPVMHGTKNSVLEKGLGHMCGTSVPIGGKGTNCVIPGHTGLKNAKLFTDLIYVGYGDKICIHVLDEVHDYSVTDISVCLPEDEDKYLQVREGRDIVTLYTCTPYGVNDHRLIVTCERTGSGSENRFLSGIKNKDLHIRPLAEAGYILSVLIMSFIYLLYGKNKERRSK